jgi:hypothetical protein
MPRSSAMALPSFSLRFSVAFLSLCAGLTLGQAGTMSVRRPLLIGSSQNALAGRVPCTLKSKPRLKFGGTRSFAFDACDLPHHHILLLSSSSTFQLFQLSLSHPTTTTTTVHTTT